MTKDIGKKLKQLRLNKKLTQQDVANKLNVTRNTISNYEIGKRSPHMKDLQKFADMYGVGLDYFRSSAKDESFDLLTRAKEVFESDSVSRETKEELFDELMKLYLALKGEKHDTKQNS